MPTHQPAPTPDFLYGTAWKEGRTALLVELALRMGFRGIDTANQRRHYFEKGVGQGLVSAYATGLSRTDLFLQTKFTYRSGQDDRLPYDPTASLPVQVAQSLASSLAHLGTEYVDSYVLHGPSAGRTRLLGVSNVSLTHLEQMIESHTEAPAFVQNRCYAHLGWDREVRLFCREKKITYQGFSLLTANAEVLHHPLVGRIAEHLQATAEQVVFSFSRMVGMLPLTGTSDPEHMQQDLASSKITLSPEMVRAIECLAG